MLKIQKSNRQKLSVFGLQSRDAPNKIRRAFLSSLCDKKENNEIKSDVIVKKKQCARQIHSESKNRDSDHNVWHSKLGMTSVGIKRRNNNGALYKYRAHNNI